MTTCNLPYKFAMTKSTVLSASRIETARALVEALFPPGELLPAGDRESILGQVDDYLKSRPSLGHALTVLLLGLESRFFLSHRRSFATAPLSERQKFLENLSGLSGQWLHALSIPFRMAYLLDEKVISPAQGRHQVKVPTSIEAARWRQQITSVEDLSDSDTLEADVVVVGTGAGGAAAAYELASRGLAVVVIEEGHYYDRRDFTGRLTEVVPKLYRGWGLTTALGNNLIPIPIGRNVGGTTTINSGTAMQTPTETLARWRAEGLTDFTDEAMAPFFEEVKTILKVQPADPRYVGEIGQVIRTGAERIGYKQMHELPRYAEGCDGQGLCQFGCPTDAKQSTNVSYMPLALNAGAFLFTGFKAEQLLKEDESIHGIVAHGKNKEGQKITLTVKARRTIIAMGSLLTPNFLRHNDIKLPALGNNLSIHPAGVVLGYFPDRTFNHAQRIPQGFGVSDLGKEGLMFEGGTVPFLGHGLMSPLNGREHIRFTENYQHTAYFGFMLRDTSKGRVRPGIHPDFPLIWYHQNRRDFALFKRGVRELARMYLAAGAKEIWIPSLSQVTTLRNETELDKWLEGPRRPRDFLMSAYHPLGTCRMGCNPEQGVVDSRLKVFGAENLYLMDGSCVPGPLGVNPQVTIMALATRAARLLAEEMQ